MCYEPSTRPPLPPIHGATGDVETEHLALEAADGNRFRAFAAAARDPDAPGIVILPDVRGLHPFYEDLAVRFAQAGVHAIAIDYFGRTAGLDVRGEDFDFMPHVEETTTEGVSADTAAAFTHLRSQRGGGVRHVYTVGFCFGGRASFNQAASDLDLAGVIGFYGRVLHGRDPDDRDAPVKLAPRYRRPVLGLFGGADEAIPPQEVERFRRALDDAGVPNEIVVYDGAPHSFFDRSFEEHRDACEDAWRRILAFTGRQLHAEKELPEDW